MQPDNSLRTTKAMTRLPMLIHLHFLSLVLLIYLRGIHDQQITTYCRTLFSRKLISRAFRYILCSQEEFEDVPGLEKLNLVNNKLTTPTIQTCQHHFPTKAYNLPIYEVLNFYLSKLPFQIFCNTPSCFVLCNLLKDCFF